MAIATYLIHWLFNAREWVDYYIRKTQPTLSTRARRGSKRHALKTTLKKQKTVQTALVVRAKIIEFLAKDNPRLAPVFIYLIMGSLLVLILMVVVWLGYLWTSSL